MVLREPLDCLTINWDNAQVKKIVSLPETAGVASLAGTEMGNQPAEVVAVYVRCLFAPKLRPSCFGSEGRFVVRR
ncbi:MAG: hypothetical protein LBU07_04875 [Coriobacteriales bacterium]|jgi:hypothetical protein|nr:hypothetical protein [Coriobacteriales bacterium]